MSNRIVVMGAVVAGVLFAALAGMYWTSQAGELPSFIPGYEAGSVVVHFKHGLAALILSLGSFLIAWFKSAAPAG
jgi:hypothetical protein